ncbi:MAG: hypothetical protein E6300_11555 [Clostridium sp.]|uniref:hypothetical protein n=1 Tax=Clostridium sp. TaxID=1506 RepID=UPI001EB64C6F|nr:hypothetical protein [Clostridium sp.]MBS5885262.1 hypothetical protein [Clostridium sp.]MDU7149117.1 hypothetical protein [Clostridium sp.]MDU7242772.1 hypothetical protein [Clostridium sp.]
MRDLKLSQSYSIIALNAQDSIHMTTIKKISLHCIAASVILESYLNGDFIEVNDKLSLKKSYLENPNITLYQEAVFKPLFNKKEIIEEDLNWWLSKASNLSNKYLKNLEVSMTDSLKGYDYMEEIPSLLGCDMFYKTAGLSLREYRSNMEEYSRVVEFLRAEVLEDGVLSDENMLMLWLLRESGCIQDIFSKGDLEIVDKRMHNLIINNKISKKLYNIHIYHGIEMAVKGFLNMKKNAIKTPTGTGINFVFPAIERSQSIFIDTEEWFPNASQRLDEVRKRLEENGHNYTIIREGAVPLIKVDNIIYEALPEATQGRIPIHGVRLRRYPI